MFRLIGLFLATLLVSGCADTFDAQRVKEPKNISLTYPAFQGFCLRHPYLCDHSINKGNTVDDRESAILDAYVKAKENTQYDEYFQSIWDITEAREVNGRIYHFGDCKAISARIMRYFMEKAGWPRDRLEFAVYRLPHRPYPDLHTVVVTDNGWILDPEPAIHRPYRNSPYELVATERSGIWQFAENGNTELIGSRIMSPK